MTSTVFFSYSRQDSEFALRLGKDLRAAGVGIWLDQLDIQPGERWDATIEKAIGGSARILVILSPASVESTNVMDEVSYALEENKRVIPILHRDCEIPFRLRRLQHTDFREDYDTALKRLLDSLGQSEPLAAAKAQGTAAYVVDTAGGRATRGTPGRWALVAAAVVAVGAIGAWIAFGTKNADPVAIAETPAPSAAPDVSVKPSEPAKPSSHTEAPRADDSPPQPTRPPFANEARVRIVNAKSQMCLTVAGGGKDNNTQTVQYLCDSDPSRYWSIHAVSDTDMVTIRNINSELCLTVAGGSTDVNLPGVQYPCDGDPSRNWIIKRAGGRKYRLVNPHSQLCLTVTDGGINRNDVVIQRPCDRDPSEDWEIRRERE